MNVLSPKKLLRKHILAVSKQVCKEQPIAFRQEQSIKLCEKLFGMIENPSGATTPGKCFTSSSSAPAKNIGLYLPLYFEIDVEPLIRKLLSSASREYKIFVPELYKKESSTEEKQMMSMRFVQVLNNQDLDENFKPVPPYNIKEPASKEIDPFYKDRLRFSKTEEDANNNTTNLDVLIVPGVAFDFWCNRLGKGGGFYDRWISAAGGKNRTVFVGVGFDEQLPAVERNSGVSSWWKQLKDNDGQTSLELDSVPMESWDQGLDYVVTPAKMIPCV